MTTHTTKADPNGTRTSVSVSAPAACPFSMAEEYAVEYLRSAELGKRESAIRVPLGAAPASLQHRVRLRFGLHLDVLEAGRRHDEVRFQWVSGSPILPDFRGTLRFRIEGTSTRVHIDGSYQPPFGAAGMMFDRLAGRRIAHASLQDLADRIAGYLGEQERLWRSSRKPAATS